MRTDNKKIKEPELHDSLVKKNEESNLTENSILKTEEEFRLIMENSADAIFITDQQGKYVYTNKAMSDLLGFTSEEMRNKTIADISPPDKIDGYFDFFKKALNEGNGYTELELIKKNGDHISTDLNVTVLPDGNVYGSCRDITERKQTEDELRSSEERLKILFEYAPDAYYLNDIKGNFLDGNIAAEKVLGYNRNEMIGQNFMKLNLLSIKQMHRAAKLLIKNSSGHSAGPEEFVLQRKDGSKINVEVISHPVKIKNQTLILGIARDITDRKNAQKKLIENEKKLYQLNADKDRFIAILGHDLKNPFNNLLGLSEILAEDLHKLDIDEVETLVNQIHSTTKRTYKLLEDILMWARTQQGMIPFKPQICSFKDVCLDIIETLNPNASAKNIIINYSAPDKINIFADIDMLKTVLRNLISNAIKFTNNGGVINIDAKENTGNATISVSDNGVGIEPKDLSKLFDISQVMSTKGTAKETGTGLGLLLCKEFVEKHQGRIWVESEIGKGSKFVFTLPLSTK